MTGIITIITIGDDIGNFNLYSNVDGYVAPFDTNVSKNTLLSGFATNNIPNGTISVRAMSTGTCTNFLNINITF